MSTFRRHQSGISAQLHVGSYYGNHPMRQKWQQSVPSPEQRMCTSSQTQEISAKLLSRGAALLQPAMRHTVRVSMAIGLVIYQCARRLHHGSESSAQRGSQVPRLPVSLGFPREY